MACVLANICFFQRFSDPNIRSWIILAEDSVLYPKIFQICQRLFQWSLMVCRTTHMNLIYLISWSLHIILILLASMDLNNLNCSFFSWFLITYIWNVFCLSWRWCLVLKVLFGTLKGFQIPNSNPGWHWSTLLYFIPSCLNLYTGYPNKP